MKSLKASKSRALQSGVADTMSDFNKTRPQFSMEDVDASQLTKALSEHQNTVIKIALVIGTLGLGVMMFRDHHDKDRDIHVQMSQAQDKLNAMKALDASINDLDTFKSALPKKLNEVELISVVSSYAKLYHVNITSLNPAESRNMGLYDIINLSFSAGTDDFKSMMLFLRKIEHSPYPLRIDSWYGHEGEDGRMTFDVNISAALIHT